jgi:hypothetical protein
MFSVRVFSKTDVLDGEALLKNYKEDGMNEELKILLEVLTAAGYEVFGMDTDGIIQLGKDGKTRDVIRVRVAAPELIKTITREEFDSLSLEQKTSFLAENGRIAQPIHGL